MHLLKACAAEAIGTLILLSGIVGSNLMAEKLLPGNEVLSTSADAFVNGCVLTCLIFLFREVSGGYFNPARTLAAAGFGKLSPKSSALFILMQLIGAMLGVMLAHAMFSQPLVQLARHAHPGGGQWISESVATFGLVLISLRLDKRAPEALPWLAGAYIAAGHWFTASTSFANPAVTLARIFTDTPAGIRFQDVPGFLLGQAGGTLLAFVLAKWLGNADMRS
jgi:glycerol uptake facilitator-like aquaporin